MDGISAPALSDAVALAMHVKENKQKKEEGQNAARLIESAMPKPLPPDSTFSTYA